MKCKRCGGVMSFQTVPVTVHRSPVTILFYVILLFVPIIGWIALFKILGGSHKQRAVTYAVCMNCGRRVRA